MLSTVALVVPIIAIILDVIGIAIPYWQQIDNLDVHVGLWKYCHRFKCVDHDDLGDVSDSLKAVRAMLLLGLVLLIGTVLCAIVKRAIIKDEERLPKLAGILAIIAGVFIIIGCIIYAANVWTDNGLFDSYLHAGFALCIVSGVAAIVGGVLFMLVKE